MKNKLLIAIFIMAMLVPTLLWFFVGGYIGSNNSENRVLSAKPELSLATISAYPQAYENYYNDHLPFKSTLVKLKTKMDYYLFHVVDSEKVLLGQDNWLFYKSAGVADLADEQPIADYQGTNHYTEEEKALIAQNVADVNSFLKDQDIQFSVLICPNKENIYSEYLSDTITKVNEESKAQLLVKYLNENTDIPIMFPEKELMQYKDAYQLYYKYDTHWNNLGGFIASQKIRELYSDEYSTLDEYEISTVEEGAVKDLAIMLNMSEAFGGDDAYYLENYKPEVSVELTEVSDDGFFHIYSSNAADERTVMVIRDSYGDAMMSDLPKDYQNVLFIHRGRFNQSYIEQYQPDIVVYQVVERATDDIKDLKLIFGLS